MKIENHNIHTYKLDPDNLKTGDVFINLNSDNIFLVVSQFNSSKKYIVNLSNNKMYSISFLGRETYLNQCKLVDSKVVIDKIYD